MVKLLALKTRGRGFDPGLLQSFGSDFKPKSHDKLLTRTYCEEAGDYAVPNVLSPRDPVSRPDLSDKNCTTTKTNLPLYPNTFSVLKHVHLYCDLSLYTEVQDTDGSLGQLQHTGVGTGILVALELGSEMYTSLLTDLYV